MMEHETKKGSERLAVLYPKATNKQESVFLVYYPSWNPHPTCKATCTRANVRRSSVLHSSRDSSHREDFAHEYGRPTTHPEEACPLRSRKHGNERVHLPRAADRLGDDGNSGLRQCLSRTESGNDHSGNLSGGGDWDGAVAVDEGLLAGRKHRANRGLDRRVGSGRRSIHDSRIRYGRAVARPDPREILELSRADGDWRNARHPFCDPSATRYGGRPRSSLPGISGCFRDSQGRAARCQGRQDSIR